MVDRVRARKYEDPTRGTQSDEVPEGLNPQEDHLEARGLFLQSDTSDDEAVHVTRDDDDNATFADAANTTPRTLTELGDKKAKVSTDDTTPGWLEDKIESADASVGITTTSPGGDEKVNLAVDVGETLRLQEIEATTPLTTSSTSEQDLFAGVSITVDKDGDYLVLLETSSAGTSSANEMAISVGLNGINTVAGSERQGKGNDKRSLISVKKITGLVIGDTIHGTYRKVGGSGSAGVFERSLTAFKMG